MVYVVVVFAGSVVGLLIGRRWGFAAAAMLGAWIALTSDVDEVSPWLLGAAYAALGAIGIAIGVAIRRLAART